MRLWGGVFEILRFWAEGLRADAIPDDAQRDADGEDQRGDGVDFRCDAATQAAPDFEREGVVSADEEKCDGDFVHRQREDKQAGGDEREFQIWESDAPERLPWRRAEIERSFFLRAIDFLQAGEELCGRNGDERGAV